MTEATLASPALKFLEDRWDSRLADTLDPAELLRYRSNLLGSDLRITNFAGGNTSSKLLEIDPLTGEAVEVLWVKGSGGDLGSIRRSGFATLFQHKLLALERSYKGVETEDDMVAMYPLCTFGNNPVAASIDTPCMAFFLFRTSITCIPTGASPWLPPPTAKAKWRSSTASSDTPWSGFPGSVRGSNWA